MPLAESDEIRIRQIIQKIKSGLIEGMKVFITYHDNNLAILPSNPTGDGTTGGWYREPTEASNWMSVKTAFKDTIGTWGTPIRVFGLQGTETAGVGLSADIPKLEQITFIGDGSSKVGWTVGTVRYGGSSYAITAKAAGDGSTDAYIYWDDDDGQTSFKTTATFATAVAAHHWVVCINDSGKAMPAMSARIWVGRSSIHTTGPANIGGGAAIGDASDYLDIGTTGDTKFVGGAGLPFGSCYGNHIGWAQAAAAQNTWYNISDADVIDGVLHNVTHDGSGKLTVTNAGMYLINYSLCFEDDIANDHIEAGIEISSSGSADPAGQSHLENKFASEEEHASSSCILDLAAGATLEVAIRTTDAGTPTINVQAINLTAVQIGGT